MQTLVVREGDAATGTAGEYARAEARCEEGERAVTGGCVWGKYPSTFLPHLNAPIGEYDPDDPEAPAELVGWVCAGTVIDADHIEAVTPSVVCELD